MTYKIKVNGSVYSAFECGDGSIGAEYTSGSYKTQFYEITEGEYKRYQHMTAREMEEEIEDTVLGRELISCSVSTGMVMCDEAAPRYTYFIIKRIGANCD